MAGRKSDRMHGRPPPGTIPADLPDAWAEFREAREAQLGIRLMLGRNRRVERGANDAWAEFLDGHRCGSSDAWAKFRRRIFLVASANPM